MKKIIILILIIAVACRNSQQNNKADEPLEEQVPLNEDIISEEIPQENTPEINLDYQAFIQNKNDTTNINRKELYKIFKYDEFSEREGYYQIPYYGCPYKGNKLGNANVILIPKTKRFDTYAITSKCNDNEPCWEKVRQEISSLSISLLCKLKYNSFLGKALSFFHFLYGIFLLILPCNAIYNEVSLCCPSTTS